jgi:hypothetical protein
MIGQYLSNNNEKSYSIILQKILELNQPWYDRFGACEVIVALVAAPKSAHGMQVRLDSLTH